MTREEAIKRIREWNLDTDDMEVLSAVIPELTENEDERIRKELVEKISNLACGCFISQEQKQNFLAYLEKQKEQKPSHKFNVGDTIHCKYDDREFTIKSVDLTNMVYKYTKEGCGNDIVYADEDFELVEQKPAECLKAERNGWYVCIKDFYGGGKKQCDAGELVQAKGGMYMMCREDISPWFRKAYYEEVRDALGSNTDTDNPKKTVWSEEDEEMRDNIICILQKDVTFTPPTRPNSCTGYGNAFYTHQTEIDWLKSLPFNLKKKNEDVAKLCSNEWSEEDSDNLERVDNYLWMLDDYVGDDCAMPQGKTDKIRGNIQGILSPWLKSLPERFNLQPKQEWSEEDKNKVAQYLHDRDGGMLWSKATEITSDILDMLRPCHPSKPSEEQPEVDLEKVLSGFTGYYAHENSGEYPSAIDIARHFYELGKKNNK